MCYLVSSLPPAASTGVRQTQMSTFSDENADGITPLAQAQSHAAALLLSGSTEVKLWKLVDAPLLTQAVQWPVLGEFA